jgi:hypothetical protein
MLHETYWRVWRHGIVTILLVCAALFARAEEEKKAPDTHAGSKFTPLNLKPVANTDPAGKDDPFNLGQPAPPRPYLWLEGEARNKQSDQEFGPENRAAASGGQVLGKEFGAKAGQWAEWYFDLPFQTEKGQIYLRAARDGRNVSATILVTLDGRNVCTFYMPQTGGLGDKEKDFGPELGRASLGHVEMGRHVLRIAAANAGDVINLDGFCITDDQQDLFNRVDGEGHMPPPAKLHMLVYPYGPITLHGIAFELLDPAANGGKGILLAAPGTVTVLPCDGARGQRLQILGAGTTEAATIEVTAVYADGASQTLNAKLGALFTLKPENAVARLGQSRFGYLATLAIEDKPLRELRFGKSAAPYVVLAATIESTPPAPSKP